MPVELVLERLAALLESGLPTDDKMRHVAAMRASVAPAAEDIDRYLIERVGQLYRGLEGAQLKQAELRELLEKLTAPPLFPAIYHNTVTERECAHGDGSFRPRYSRSRIRRRGR